MVFNPNLTMPTHDTAELIWFRGNGGMKKRKGSSEGAGCEAK